MKKRSPGKFFLGRIWQFDECIRQGENKGLKNDADVIRDDVRRISRASFGQQYNINTTII